MKTIPPIFKKHGWNFDQMTRQGNVAIFARWKWQGPRHLEVVRIRQHDGFPLPDGTRTEPGESYPSEKQWGRDGFTFSGEGMHTKAAQKMRELLES